MSNNYMLMDWYAILAGFGLFFPLAFVPGYAFGWFLDIAGFRRRTLQFRIALSIPLSIAIGPILSYLVWRFLSLVAVEAMYGGLCLYVIFLGVRGFRERSSLALDFSRTQLKILGVVLAWLIIAVLMLADIQFRDRLYYPVIAFDYAVRTAFVSAIGTFGVPAQNPFYFPGHATGLHYHYLWLIQCALLERLGGTLVDPRQALIAGTMWCGIAMFCLVPLYLKLFSPLGGETLHRRTLVGMCLMGITGLDVVPALLELWLHFKGLAPVVSPSVEWWNQQVDGWLYTMLWEPHYMCSLIACLTAFLILWKAPGQGRGGRRLISAAVAGLALATAAGAGIYVAFVFAIFLVLWTLIVLLNRGQPAFKGSETPILLTAGAVAVLASTPFLLELIGIESSGRGGSVGSGLAGAPIQFTVRGFALMDFSPLFDHAWKALMVNAALLPLNYFFELGFFFAVGWVTWKRFRAKERRPTRQEWAAFAMAGSSIVLCTFLQSTVIANNDLGWRGFLPAQFILLLWAADLFGGNDPQTAGGMSRWRFRNKPVMLALLLLGAAGTVYDLAILRFYPVWSDQGKLPKIFWMSDDEQLGRRTYAAREAYRWLKTHTPPEAIIQQNPDPQYQDTFYGLYANRQTVVEDRSCGSVFSTDTGECEPIVGSLKTLFANGATVRTMQNVCTELPIAVAVAKDTDAVWSDRGSWVWTQEPIYSNDFFRLIPCTR